MRNESHTARERRRSTKIVATLGPSSSTETAIEALARAGADVFRLNFTHGTHADHAMRHAAVRAIEARIGHPIGVLLDLQGPKLRVGQFASGRAQIVKGRPFVFDRDPAPGAAPPRAGSAGADATTGSACTRAVMHAPAASAARRSLSSAR